MTNQPFDVVGVGVATLDFVGIAASEPLLGYKHQLADWLEAGGGPVATALVALARLGVRVCMAGAVGNDMYGQRILEDLRGAGVATEGMQVRPGASHVAFALAEPGQDRRTIWWHNDPDVFAGLTIDPALLRGARALHIDTLVPAAAIEAAHTVRAHGGLVMLDAGSFRAQARDLMPLCDAIVVSERFGHEATGEQAPGAAARALHDRYGSLVVVTAGVRGSWCVSRDEAFHTPAFDVPIVDTTGAGDVFHGGFLYGLLQGWPLHEVARFASATAALKCRAAGGRAGIPTRAEIDTLLREGHLRAGHAE
jgi:ribokinase